MEGMWDTSAMQGTRAHREHPELQEQGEILPDQEDQETTATGAEMDQGD